jgi:dipeptidyl-peptidase-4
MAIEMARFGICGLLLASAMPLVAQQPARVVWAPGGRQFAFVENRSVWLYDVPAGTRRELIALGRLDRLAVQGNRDATEWPSRRLVEQPVQWSSSGKELLISAAGDLFLYHLDSGRLDQITATPEVEHDAKLSPDGAHVAFRRDHDLYALDIGSRTLTRLTQDGSPTLLNGETDWVYPEELGLTTAYWWSPDSTHIAYLQFDVSRESMFPLVSATQPKARLEPQLYPQPGTPNAEVHLGVVGLSGNRHWMDLGRPRDRLIYRVQWAPDARTIAVERFNRVQNRLDLLLADMETGEARIVLQEQDPYWINGNNDFRFLKNGEQFLWGSERDGFHHLYLYSADGKHVTQLTHGDWEVTGIAGVDESARQIFYTSTEAGVLERQFYRIDFEGKHKQRLTQEKGSHIVSLSPSCEYYLDLYSALVRPPQIDIHDRNGLRIRAYQAPAKPPESLLPAEIRSFETSDGATLYARLIKPARFETGKKYSAIVMVYGGPGHQMIRDAWRVNPLEQKLAAEGFVIWEVDNRGSSGRGHAFETAIHHNLGQQELKDQEEGLDYLVSLGFVDRARVGIHGWSYGGFLTLYALTNSAAFRSGVAGAPVTDWHNYDSIYTERYLGFPDANAEAYRHSSPLTYATSLNGSLLLLHSVEDEKVHFQNSIQMSAALENAGKLFDMVVYPDRSHGIGSSLRDHADRTIVEYFERTLR